MTLVFEPVYSSDPESENHKFWKYTPSGKLEMVCVNPEAVKCFQLGQEFYLDFTPAE